MLSVTWLYYCIINFAAMATVCVYFGFFFRNTQQEKYIYALFFSALYKHVSPLPLESIYKPGNFFSSSIHLFLVFQHRSFASFIFVMWFSIFRHFHLLYTVRVNKWFIWQIFSWYDKRFQSQSSSAQRNSFALFLKLYMCHHGYASKRTTNIKYLKLL